MERQQDITLGAIFVALGIAAALGATAYTGASGNYPMVLGLLLALTGLVVAFRAIRSEVSVERILIDAPVKLFTAIGIGVAYVALVVPFGFYTASFFLMLALPFALGFRQPVYALTVGAIFTVIVYVVFSVFLERPLPRELIFSFFGGGS
jgi:hypothetical protein